MTARLLPKNRVACRLPGTRGAPQALCWGRLAQNLAGRRTMQQKVYWLDYDAVALAVLAVGLGTIGLLTLSI